MENLWWGYLHISGDIQAKRFFDQQDIEEAKASSFCKKVFQAFEARDREAALEHINSLLKKELPEQ